EIVRGGRTRSAAQGRQGPAGPGGGRRAVVARAARSGGETVEGRHDHPRAGQGHAPEAGGLRRRGRGGEGGVRKPREVYHPPATELAQEARRTGPAQTGAGTARRSGPSEGRRGEPGGGGARPEGQAGDSGSAGGAVQGRSRPDQEVQD